MSTPRSLMLDEETLETLKGLAARRGMTAAALVQEMVRAYASADLETCAEENWPEWMDLDAIDAVKAGLTTIERLRARHEAWQRQAEAPLTEEQEEECAGWMRIRVAAAARCRNGQ